MKAVKSGMMVVLMCARMDCEVETEVFLDENNVVVDLRQYDDQRYVKTKMPEGWGFDKHDGVNAALHCPAHRKPPTPEEIERIMAEFKEVSSDVQI